MSQKKPERWSVRFELAPEREADVKLHDYLSALAENSEVSKWIRDTLIAAMPTSTVDKPIIKSVSTVDKRSEDVKQVESPPIARPGPPRVTTELTPAEIIQRRKAEAQAKFAAPTVKKGGD